MEACFNFSAIIISGGYDFANTGYGKTTVEVFVPSSNYSCLLPAVPSLFGRSYHTQNGFLMCGGNFESKTCLNFNSSIGAWTNISDTLKVERNGHVSWSVKEGTIILGGTLKFHQPAELVRLDGTVEYIFHLNNNHAFW